MIARATRPSAIRWLNRTLPALEKLGIGRGPLTPQALLAAAQRRTGLSDFGSTDFVEPLSVLVHALEHEAKLHAVGRAISKTRLVSALSTRLAVQRVLSEHPEIAHSTLEPPIVIAGLQRTGTTMLHRLLASDPLLRSLSSYEAIAPVRAERGVDTRLLRAKLSERALAYMAPDFFAIHPVEADAPEEDVLLLDYAFMSTVPEATLHVPSYAAWLESADHTPAYRYLETLLKVLTRARGPSRWVLKTPHHLEYLDVLRRVFPGAQIIQTHREPRETMASFCSRVFHGRRVFSDEVDPCEVGRHWSRKVGRMLDRALAERAAAADEGFFDLSYRALVDRPLAEVERLYGNLGRTFDEPTRARMEATRRDNPQHKYGLHRYELSDFGLSDRAIAPAFAAYRARFAACL